MVMSTRKCLTLLVLLLAVMLFVFIGCSELESPATPIEIPSPAVVENQEEDPNPEATPIEIPADEPVEEQAPIL